MARTSKIDQKGKANMHKPIAIILFGLALAGCQTAAAPPPIVQSSAGMETTAGYVRPNDAQALDAARRAVAAKLKDPESARFTDVSRRTTPNARGEPTDMVCGRVNAKNAFGGYTGGKPFAYFVADKSLYSYEGGDVDRMAINNMCPWLRA